MIELADHCCNLVTTGFSTVSPPLSRELSLKDAFSDTTFSSHRHKIQIGWDQEIDTSKNRRENHNTLRKSTIGRGLYSWCRQLDFHLMEIFQQSIIISKIWMIWERWLLGIRIRAGRRIYHLHLSSPNNNFDSGLSEPCISEDSVGKQMNVSFPLLKWQVISDEKKRRYVPARCGKS